MFFFVVVFVEFCFFCVCTCVILEMNTKVVEINSNRM